MSILISLSATGNKSVLKSNRSDEQIKIVTPESDFFVDADLRGCLMIRADKTVHDDKICPSQFGGNLLPE